MDSEYIENPAETLTSWTPDADGLGYTHTGGACVRRGPSDRERWIGIPAGCRETMGKGFPLLSEAKAHALAAGYGLAAMFATKRPAPKAPAKAKANAAHEALALDIVAAIANATLAVQGMPDGGTCNLDSVSLRVRKSAGLEAACKAVGITLDRLGGRRNDSYNVVGGARVGQGSRATKFCELVAKELQEKGHAAYVTYYVD